MRVVSEWNYKHLKITIFHYNEKFSLKAEDNLMEQIYKFRDGQINSVNDIKEKIKDSFYDSVISTFEKMGSHRDAIFLPDDNEEEFDIII